MFGRPTRQYPKTPSTDSFLVIFNMTHGHQQIELDEANAQIVADALEKANDMNDEFMAIGGVGTMPAFIVNLHHVQSIIFNRI